MQGNVKLLAMIFVDRKMVLVPGGHIIGNDTTASVLHLPCNMGTQSGHIAFEEVVLCSKAFRTRMRVLSAQIKRQK